MYLLPEEVKKNGYKYALVERTHNNPQNKNVAIYQQLDGKRIVGFEVFIIPRRLKDTPTPSGVILPPSEVFPGNETFGKTSFAARNPTRAQYHYQNLINRINETVTNS